MTFHSEIRHFTVAIGIFAISLSSSAGCLNPVMSEGAITYLPTSPGAFAVCDGVNWLHFKSTLTATACTTSGELAYVPGTGYHYCNANKFWVTAAKATCSSPSLTYAQIYNVAANIINVHALVASADEKKLYAGSLGKLAAFSINDATGALTLLGASANSGILGNQPSMILRAPYMYTISAGGFGIYDVSAATPSLRGSISSPSSEMLHGNGIAFSENPDYVFTTSWDSGASGNKCYFHSINVSNPSLPVISKSLDATALLTAATTEYCNKVQVIKNTAFIATALGLLVLNVTDPANPVFLNYLDDNRATSSHGLAVIDETHLATVTQSGSHFVTFNVDPSTGGSTVLAQTTNTSVYQGVYNVHRAGDYILTGSYDTGAVALTNIANPAIPVVAASGIPGALGVSDVASAGHYIFAASSTNSSITSYNTVCNPKDSGSYGLCSAAGMMKYLPVTKALAWCNGTSWLPLAN